MPVEIASLVVAIVALLLSIIALWLQRRHDVLSVKPIGEISVGNFEDRIVVVIENKGTGPLLVERLIVRNQKGSERSSVIEFMPPIGDYWKMFIHELDGKAILPGARKTLIEYVGNPKNKQFILNRNRIRSRLSELTVNLIYKDIYNHKMPLVTRRLSYFSRPVSTSKTKLEKDLL